MVISHKIYSSSFVNLWSSNPMNHFYKVSRTESKMIDFESLSTTFVVSSLFRGTLDIKMILVGD